MSVQAITLWQPWASLLAHGLKRVETRSWKYPGPLPAVLAVHAGKKSLDPAWSLPEAEYRHYREALAGLGCAVFRARAQGGEREVAAVGGLPLGAVLGLVRLVACHPTERVRCVAGRDGGPQSYVGQGAACRLMISGREKAFGDYRPGRFAWVCDCFVCLPHALPVRGAQGLWKWEPSPAVAPWVDAARARLVVAPPAGAPR